MPSPSLFHFGSFAVQGVNQFAQFLRPAGLTPQLNEAFSFTGWVEWRRSPTLQLGYKGS